MYYKYSCIYILYSCIAVSKITQPLVIINYEIPNKKLISQESDRLRVTTGHPQLHYGKTFVNVTASFLLYLTL